MKTTIIVTMTLILSSLFTAFSQPDTMSLDPKKKALSANDEFLHAMAVLDKNVIENAKVIIHNLETKKSISMEMAKYHSDEIGRSLQASEDYLTRLQKATDIAMDEMVIAYLSGLHKHYQKAIEEQRAIQAELMKSSPVPSTIIMNATQIHSEISKAGSEQMELQKKMNIKEPEMQQQKK